jgi:GT2 family glycosyltransferase
VFISANCAFTRGVLDAVGPMRADLGPGSGGVPWGDDTDWHRRATAAGFVTEFDESLAVRHLVQANRISVGAVLERAERVGRTRARLEWDGRRPSLGSLMHLRFLAAWGRVRAGSDLARRCTARRLCGYADELARMRR